MELQESTGLNTWTKWGDYPHQFVRSASPIWRADGFTRNDNLHPAILAPAGRSAIVRYRVGRSQTFRSDGGGAQSLADQISSPSVGPLLGEFLVNQLAARRVRVTLDGQRQSRM